MDFKGGAQRDVSNNAPAAQKQIAPVNKKQPKRVVAGALASLAVIAVVAAAIVTILNQTHVLGATAGVNKDDNQAVFLTNGQVYFGKLQSVNGDYVRLTNIYYLQVDGSIQSAGTGSAATTSTSTEGKTATDNNVQLVKLGNELHGPRDSMEISRQQVLFWENLKPDSKVSEAIKNYKQ